MEYKHADFHRTIKGFNTLSEIWREISLSPSSSPTPGHVAYAKREAKKYLKLAVDTENRFRRAGVGIPSLCDIPPGKTLAEQVEAMRLDEAKLFPKVNA